MLEMKEKQANNHCSGLQMRTPNLEIGHLSVVSCYKKARWEKPRSR